MVCIDYFSNLCSQYPEPLQTILKIAQVKGALAAPDAMMRAMKWVYDQEEKYMPRYRHLSERFLPLM
jgi:hypothetical protein